MRIELFTKSVLPLALVLAAAGAALSDDADELPVLAASSNVDCDGDGVIDAEEIAADAVLDSNENGRLDYCEGFSIDRLELSLAEGGTVRMSINLGPAMAGRLYWVLGTTGGTEPGMKLGFTKVPLNHDGPGGYMPQTLQHPNQDEIEHTFGVLDAYGKAEARFKLPPDSDSGLAGNVVDHAFVIFELVPRTPVWASNAVRFRLVP